MSRASRRESKEDGKVTVEQIRKEAESLLLLNSQVLCTHYKICFKELRQSSLMYGVPMGAIFITEREKCRFLSSL